MKRIAICLLVLFMIISIPCAAFGASNQIVSGEKIDEHFSAGDTFSFDVSLKGNLGMIVGAVKVSWPTQDLKLNSIKYGSVMPDNGTAPIGDTNKGALTVTFGSDTASKNYTLDGVLFTLTFQVLDSATPGSKEISLQYGRNADDFLDFDLNVVPTTFESGSIIVQGHVHELVKTPAKAPTETDPGNNAYWTCTGCGKFFSDAEGFYEVEKDSWIIPATGAPTEDPAPVTPEDPVPGTPDDPGQGLDVEPGSPSTPSDASSPAGTDPAQQPGPADPQEPSKDVIFADVKTTDYYYDPVKWAVSKGITNGVSETRFGPAQNCTRGQVATFLWGVNGSENVEIKSKFNDVPANAYFAKAVAWAVEQGITAGLSETDFGPSRTVTRAQFVTMLWVAKGMPAANAVSAFSDVPADAYYAKAVAWAYANGITAGKSAANFAPDDPCTRGQIVTFLYNAYK